MHNCRYPECNLSVEQKENKALVVVVTDTGADPWTMMVKAKCAPFTVSVFVLKTMTTLNHNKWGWTQTCNDVNEAACTLDTVCSSVLYQKNPKHPKKVPITKMSTDSKQNMQKKRGKNKNTNSSASKLIAETSAFFP